MPGITITTASRAGASSVASPESARYFVTGLFERGPVVPTLVRSHAELVSIFGQRAAYSFAWDDLQVYFREGGGEAYVRRVVGPGAVLGTATLPDADGAAALRLDAASAGAWSADVAVGIAAGTLADTVTASVYVGGDLQYRFTNLADAPSLVAALTSTGLLRVVDLAGVLPAPTPEGAPVVLSAGDDDRAAVGTAQLLDAAREFSIDYGTGVMAIPGYEATAIGADLRQIAADSRRIAYLHGGRDDERAQIRTTARGLLDIDGDRYGLLWPWVSAPALAGTGERIVPPTGYVAAKRAVAHRDTGSWRVPAGELALAGYITGVHTKVSAAEAADLDAAGVSVVRTFRDRTMLYGYRSLSTDEVNYPLLNQRDATNVVVQAIEENLAGRIFGSVDPGGAFYGSIQAAIIGIVEPIRAAGGLFPLLDANGEELDAGYLVVCDETNNDVASLALGRVNATVGLRWAPTATMIEVQLVNVGITTAF